MLVELDSRAYVDAMVAITSRRRNKKSLVSASVRGLEPSRMVSNVVKAQACAVDMTMAPYAKVQGFEGG